MDRVNDGFHVWMCKMWTLALAYLLFGGMLIEVPQL